MVYKIAKILTLGREEKNPCLINSTQCQYHKTKNTYEVKMILHTIYTSFFNLAKKRNKISNIHDKIQVHFQVMQQEQPSKSMGCVSLPYAGPHCLENCLLSSNRMVLISHQKKAMLVSWLLNIRYPSHANSCFCSNE